MLPNTRLPLNPTLRVLNYNSRIEIASTDHGDSVYKGRLLCTEFSIEFSYVNPI